MHNMKASPCSLLEVNILVLEKQRATVWYFSLHSLYCSLLPSLHSYALGCFFCSTYHSYSQILCICLACPSFIVYLLCCCVWYVFICFSLYYKYHTLCTGNEMGCPKACHRLPSCSEPLTIPIQERVWVHHENAWVYIQNHRFLQQGSGAQCPQACGHCHCCCHCCCHWFCC